MVIDESTVLAFMDLFAGRPDVWGSVQGKCNREQVTKQHYERHLRGEVSLGVYMLRDDATCRFFAIDVDEKDIEKPLAIRQEFAALGINSYMAFSKRKGYHVFCFADKKPFEAADVRRLCHGVLNKLGISAECFPKQDKLDEQTPTGSYLNLPCFGSSRMFFNTNKVKIDIADAVKRIRGVSQAKIDEAIKTLPPPPSPFVKKAVSKGNSPEWVNKALQGVLEGERDSTCTKLAGYFKTLLPRDVTMAILTIWGNNCKPPFPSDAIQKCVTSVYRYGIREHKVAKPGKPWHAEVPL